MSVCSSRTLYCSVKTKSEQQQGEIDRAQAAPGSQAVGNSLIPIQGDRHLRRAELTDVAAFRGQRKQTLARSIDQDVRGFTNVARALQVFAVFADLSHRHGLHRSKLVYIAGTYLAQEFRQRKGLKVSALKAYGTKDYNSGNFTLLRRKGLIDKLPSGQVVLTDTGQAIAREIISGLKYAHDNFTNSIKRAARKQPNS